MLKAYYQLTKPGIIYGNAITAIAGFFLASKWNPDWLLLVAMLVGVSLVIGSACVINNYLDRQLDQHMERTKKRASVTGQIGLMPAMIYAAVLVIAGFAILITQTNGLTVFIGLLAYIDYIIFYGWAKRHTVYGTEVGAIAGAAPIVAGYTAVTGRLDVAAITLFLMMFFWQMPHFYSIAIYRLKDYKAAKLPVLPAVKGLETTRYQIIWYVLGFTAVSGLLYVYGYVGWWYLVVMLPAGLFWLFRGFQGYRLTKPADITAWARKMFFLSLIIVLILSVMVAVGSPGL